MEARIHFLEQEVRELKAEVSRLKEALAVGGSGEGGKKRSLEASHQPGGSSKKSNLR